jgi:hypothetical protein
MSPILVRLLVVIGLLPLWSSTVRIGFSDQPAGSLYQARYSKVPDAYAAARHSGDQNGNEVQPAVRDALQQTSFEIVRGPLNFDEKGDPLCSDLRDQDC